ncbi:SDR family oxidoreductase, partial [Cobetia marina]
ADLGRLDGCDTLIQTFPDTDIVINNVGIFAPQDFFATDDDTWEQFFQVNVLSAVRLARHYARGMKERD